MSSLQVPTTMSSDSDCHLVVEDLDSQTPNEDFQASSNSVFLPSTSADDELKCHHFVDIEEVKCHCHCMLDIEQPMINKLKRDHSQRHSQRSHRHSRNNSTNSSRRSRQGSQRRKGSQKRRPSRQGSARDKKRLLSEQKSDNSTSTPSQDSKPRRAVQVIITVAVLLTLMSIIIVAVTLLMSNKMEEMVGGGPSSRKPMVFPAEEILPDTTQKNTLSSLYSTNGPFANFPPTIKTSQASLSNTSVIPKHPKRDKAASAGSTHGQNPGKRSSQKSLNGQSSFMSKAVG